MSALERLAISTPAPAKNLDYETLKDLTSSLLKEHEDHGLELVAGCRWCTYRAAWKVYHNAPSKQKGIEFLANIPNTQIESILSDVCFALQDWETIPPRIQEVMNRA